MTVVKRCRPSFKVMELHCFGYRDKRPGEKDVVKSYSTSSTEGKGGTKPLVETSRWEQWKGLSRARWAPEAPPVAAGGGHRLW